MARAIGGQPKSCPVYQTVSQGGAPAGIEYYLPLFFEEMATLFDYVSSDAVIINEPLADALESINSDAQARYESLRYDIERPILSPDELLLASTELYECMGEHPRIDIAVDSRARGADILWGGSQTSLLMTKPRSPLLGCETTLIRRPHLIAAETIGRREMIDTALMKRIACRAC